MNPDHRHEPLGLEERTPRVGAFDAQLSFPAPFAPVAQPIATVIKRDGRREKFDTRKIAGAIFQAADSLDAGDADLSRGLASAVAIYLNKHLKDDTPRVDDIHDAVERVLIEMGHVQTAWAYVCHRDRQERRRQLREGDTHSLLRELARARQLRETPEPGGGLFTHTRHEGFIRWNRARIVEALVTATALDSERAETIAREVEQQIKQGQIETLTPALVRELVDAKLVEHGLDLHRTRHLRLGLPLYEAEQIICSPRSGDGARAHHPDATDRLLARRLKEEFALSHIFSEEVAERHVRGDLHLHNLESIDRLESALVSPEFIKRFGGFSPDTRRRSRPAREPDALIAQLTGWTAALDHHFAKGVSWDALNVSLAPYIESLPENDLRDIAKVLLYECCFQNVRRELESRETRIGVSASVPEYLRSLPVIGPEGAQQDRHYDALAYRAEHFAWMLLDEYARMLHGTERDALPGLTVTWTRESLDRPEQKNFLELACRIAVAGGDIAFAVSREEPMLPYTEDLPGTRDAIAHCITLNLPRVAYRSQGRADSEFDEAIDALVDSAAQAHLQKHAFLRRLLALDDAGPLALLNAKVDGSPLLDHERARYLVGFTGLAECAQIMTKNGPAEKDATDEFTYTLLDRIRQRCAEWRRTEDIPIMLAATESPEAAHRLAALDLWHYRDAALKVLPDSGPDTESRYSTSLGAPLPGDAPLMERIRTESRLYPLLENDTTLHLPAWDPDTTPSAVADLLRKAFQQTTVSAITFGRD
ncbi:MAG: hypothetical protein IID08_05555 [Candidatus Hydrogenedentes bacterium]|nr:hypothetical protein [Candidatus Hydrogenedentota bacterium]